MARVIIAGGRTFNNYEQLVKDCDAYLTDSSNIILSGCAKGADALGERYAKERGFPVEYYPANWSEYGKKAGYIRNIEMANKADTLQLLWDYKDGKIDWNTYVERYTKDVLDHLEPSEIYKELEQLAGDNKWVCLTCWEKSDDHCHRRLVLEWLNEYLADVEYKKYYE